MRKGTLSMVLGTLCISAALALTLYNQLQAQRAGSEAEQVLGSLSQIIPTEPESSEPVVLPTEVPSEPSEDVTQPLPSLPNYLKDPQMEMPVQPIDGYDYIGILRIPELELELPIMSQWSYKQLKIAPCRYTGSAYLNNMTICAHNYSSHFGGLKNLSIGDEVSFTDMDGNKFFYRVAELETLQPSAIEEMTNSPWDLTLFTCTLGGKTRVTVRCERVTP